MKNDELEIDPGFIPWCVSAIVVATTIALRQPGVEEKQLAIAD